MPSLIKYYVNIIDYISLKTGRATMYLVFVMMFILILSFVTRNIINMSELSKLGFVYDNIGRIKI